MSERVRQSSLPRYIPREVCCPAAKCSVPRAQTTRSPFASVSPRRRLRGKSDTLEARAKLTSDSALELGGLPRLSVPTKLHEDW